MARKEQARHPLWDRCEDGHLSAPALRADAPAYHGPDDGAEASSRPPTCFNARPDLSSSVPDCASRYYGAHTHQQGRGNVECSPHESDSTARQSPQFKFRLSPTGPTAPLTPDSIGAHSREPFTATTPFTIQDFGDSEFNSDFQDFRLTPRQVFASRPGGRSPHTQQQTPSPQQIADGNNYTAHRKQQYSQQQQPASMGGGGHGHGRSGRGGGAGGSGSVSRYRAADPQPALESADGFLYHVQFKRSHRYYGLHPHAWELSSSGALAKGLLVIVEADRGVDIGVLRGRLQVWEHRDDRHTAGHRGRGFAVGDPSDGKRLLRLASEEEGAAVFAKVAEEEQTLQVAREKAAQRFLAMTIIDAEFQLDRHKLTFFFEAERRVDFRELVSELFSLYKTRIWMAQVDSGTNAALARLERADSTGSMDEVLSSQRDTDEDARWLAGFVGLLPSPQERAELESQCSPPQALLGLGAGAGSDLAGCSIFAASAESASFPPSADGALQTALLLPGQFGGSSGQGGMLGTAVGGYPTQWIDAPMAGPPGLGSGFHSYPLAQQSISQSPNLPQTVDCMLRKTGDRRPWDEGTVRCADFLMAGEHELLVVPTVGVEDASSAFNSFDVSFSFEATEQALPSPENPVEDFAAGSGCISVAAAARMTPQFPEDGPPMPATHCPQPPTGTAPASTRPLPRSHRLHRPGRVPTLDSSDETVASDIDRLLWGIVDSATGGQ